VRAHSMADTRRVGTVKFSALLDSLAKLIPNLTREFLDQLPPAFGMDHDSTVTQEEWRLMFDYNAKAPKATGPKPSATKRQNELKRSQAEQQANQAVLKYLCEVLEKEGMTPQRLFRKADKNFNQVIDVEELKELLK